MKTVQQMQEERIEAIVNRAKGEVCKEFEKVCVTEMSFNRMRKEMHNIFDAMINEIKLVK